MRTFVPCSLSAAAWKDEEWGDGRQEGRGMQEQDVQQKKLQEERGRESTEALGRAERAGRCNEEQILGMGRGLLADRHKRKRWQMPGVE